MAKGKKFTGQVLIIRMPPLLRHLVEARADDLGVTISHLTRKALEQECKLSHEGHQSADSQ
jgi:hypothetical protein